MACGEKPVVLCDEPAKDAPRNLVVDVELRLAAAETFVANVIHLVLDNYSLFKVAWPGESLLFNVLRVAVRDCSTAVILVEIRFITNLKKVKHDPSVSDCRRRECCHDRTCFEKGSGNIV